MRVFFATDHDSVLFRQIEDPNLKTVLLLPVDDRFPGSFFHQCLFIPNIKIPLFADSSEQFIGMIGPDMQNLLFELISIHFPLQFEVFRETLQHSSRGRDQKTICD
jgi:hypothetical protein